MEKTYKLSKEGRVKAGEFFSSAYYDNISTLEMPADEWHNIGVPIENIEEVEEEKVLTYSERIIKEYLNILKDDPYYGKWEKEIEVDLVAEMASHIAKNYASKSEMEMEKLIDFCRALEEDFADGEVTTGGLHYITELFKEDIISADIYVAVLPAIVDYTLPYTLKNISNDSKETSTKE